MWGIYILKILLLNISRKKNFIYKSCARKKIPMNHHWNVIQFEKNQKIFIQINVYFWKKNIFNCVCHWDYFKNQFLKFPFGKITIKYEILKLMFM